MDVKTPLEMLYHWEARKPNTVFLRQPIDGVFHELTWKQTADQVRRIASALIAQNMSKAVISQYFPRTVRNGLSLTWPS